MPNSPTSDDGDNDMGDGVDPMDHVQTGDDSNKGGSIGCEAEQPIITAPSRWRNPKKNRKTFGIEGAVRNQGRRLRKVAAIFGVFVLVAFVGDKELHIG
ncbi:hypothetical protein QYF36_002499 [Acer negundo]|nr:hypothetical protein QYF36_002499 [Acer negundo]